MNGGASTSVGSSEQSTRLLAWFAAVGALGVLTLVLLIGNTGLRSEFATQNPSKWWWLPIVAGVAVAATSARVLTIAPRSSAQARLAKAAFAVLGTAIVIAGLFIGFYATSWAEP